MIRCSRKAACMCARWFRLYFHSFPRICHVFMLWYITHSFSHSLSLLIPFDRFIVNSHTLNIKYAARMYKCGKISDSIRINRLIPPPPPNRAHFGKLRSKPYCIYSISILLCNCVWAWVCIIFGYTLEMNQKRNVKNLSHGIHTHQGCWIYIWWNENWEKSNSCMKIHTHAPSEKETKPPRVGGKEVGKMVERTTLENFV